MIKNTKSKTIRIDQENIIEEFNKSRIIAIINNPSDRITDQKVIKEVCEHYNRRKNKP